jgi:DNA-binding PadR family transcriptional regulator
LTAAYAFPKLGTMNTLTQRLYQRGETGDELATEALEAIRELVTAIERLLTPGLSIADIAAATRDAGRVLRKFK